MFVESDTIAAISTALGNSGINIIRVSGENAFEVINDIFKKGKSKKDFQAKLCSSHTIHYGFIVNNNDIIDEVMISLFKSPNSYTMEDVVEINCHGGAFIAKRILKILLEKGVRLAKPGEFSKRAFLNGRIDLSQAEAVMDLIKSQNEYSVRSSLNQLGGGLSNKIKILRERILYDIAYIESALDDPEHYNLDNYNETLCENMNSCLNEVNNLLKTFAKGRIVTQGINTVIAGRPNAGKSSLMNNILNEDKAIVTDIPGTTRDIIEYSVSIGKINLNLFDTAGVHDTDDRIEKIGIEKTLDSIDNAQLILYVIDTSDVYEENDFKLYNIIKNKAHIVIFNKSDLNCHDFDRSIFADSVCIDYSTIDGRGFDKLSDTIEKMFLSNDIDMENEIYISNIRHYELLKHTQESINNVINEIESDLSEDMVTIDMMDAYTFLGEIIGQTVTDDLADKIFSEFCMGK